MAKGKKDIKEVIAPPVNPITQALAPKQPQSVGTPQQINPPATTPTYERANEGVNVKTGESVNVGVLTNTGFGQTMNKAFGMTPENEAQKRADLEAINRLQMLNRIENRELISPAPLGADIMPAKPDLLDVGKILGGATAGAGAGAAVGAGLGTIVPGVGNVVGGIAGGIIGGIGGAVSTAFYSSASDRKQQVKTTMAKFTDATTQMDNIIKDVNAGNYGKQQARMNWEAEKARISQSEREIKAQQDALFGEKLSKSLDEMAKIESWKRNLLFLEREFEMAMAMPDPARVVQSRAVAPEVALT